MARKIKGNMWKLISHTRYKFNMESENLDPKCDEKLTYLLACLGYEI
jgi:hypothetical protein